MNQKDENGLPKIGGDNKDGTPDIPSPSSPGYRDKLHFLNNTSRELIGQ